MISTLSRALLFVALVCTPLSALGDGSTGFWLIVNGKGVGSLLLADDPGSEVILTTLQPLNLTKIVDEGAGTISEGSPADCKGRPHYHGAIGTVADTQITKSSCGWGAVVLVYEHTVTHAMFSLLLTLDAWKRDYTSLQAFEASIDNLDVMDDDVDTLSDALVSAEEAGHIDEKTLLKLDKAVEKIRAAAMKLRNGSLPYPSLDRSLRNAAKETQLAARNGTKLIATIKAAIKKFEKAGVLDTGPAKT